MTLHHAAPAGSWAGSHRLASDRSIFRYVTSSGQRDTLAVDAYHSKGREGYLTLAAARQIAAGWSRQYKDGARNLRQHFAKAEADRLQANEDARQQVDIDVAADRKLSHL